MYKIRCDDEDVVELFIVRQGRVGSDHLIIGCIALDRIGPVSSFFERDCRIREKRTSDDPASAVHVNGFLMGIHDEGSLASADQTDIERFIGHDVFCSVGDLYSFRKMLICPATRRSCGI